MTHGRMIRQMALAGVLALMSQNLPGRCQEKVPLLREESANAATLRSAGDGAAVAEADNPNSDRWLVLLCGLPGDGNHRERLTDAVRKIASAAEAVLNVHPSRLVVMVGDETMAADLGSEIPQVTICTRQSVETALRELGPQVGREDSCWLILLGHAQLYNGRSTFNILGPDFDAAELARWLKPIQCRERVHWVTMPVTGFWLKPLAGPGRVSISATDLDFEITGTEMPYALADVISGQGESQQLEDIDGDQQLSLLDLYLAINLEIYGRFKSMDRLQTEHAQLDDNGDGLGSELQAPYILVETAEGETTEPNLVKPPVPTQNRDGDASRRISIGPPPATADAAEVGETVDDTAVPQ